MLWYKSNSPFSGSAPRVPVGALGRRCGTLLPPPLRCCALLGGGRLAGSCCFRLALLLLRCALLRCCLSLSQLGPLRPSDPAGQRFRKVAAWGGWLSARRAAPPLPLLPPWCPAALELPLLLPLHRPAAATRCCWWPRRLLQHRPAAVPVPRQQQRQQATRRAVPPALVSHCTWRLLGNSGMRAFNPVRAYWWERGDGGGFVVGRFRPKKLVNAA